MFVSYLIYKKSWIGFVVLLLLLTNTLLFVDSGIQVELHSILYLNGLFLLFSVVFLFVQYKNETSYYKILRSQMNEVDEGWFERIPTPRNRFPEGETYSILKNVYEYEQTKRSENNASNQASKTDLAAWVHEMKTPLTAMKITLDAHQSNELAQRLQSNWLKVNLLLDRQLYISRLATLDTDLLPEQLEVKTLLRMEIRELSSWCHDKNIAIQLTGDPASIVHTDKKWCGFVIRQLLTNAVKYSPVGGTMTIHTEWKDEQSVMVTIKDEGPGIKAHDLPRIFDRGFTGDNGRVQHGATGMGLYLARVISKKLQIQLHVSSVCNESTSVSMIFPQINSFDQINRSSM
ncbi:sensor histidine kinase [Alkalicoccobacillus gibsonii]|uniref:sensor histidine kinase n=1 Tax=Alkalicoccobacillus gibsonii TaxID=79881 RepID=UPI0035130E7B